MARISPSWRILKTFYNLLEYVLERAKHCRVLHLTGLLTRMHMASPQVAKAVAEKYLLKMTQKMIRKG